MWPYTITVWVCVLSHFSHVQLFVTLWTVARLLCPWISQVRILEWIAISYFRGSSQPRDQTGISCISSLAGGFFTVHTTLPPILVLIQLAVTKASSHVSWSMTTRLCPIGAWSTMGHRVPCTIQHSYNAFPASQSPGEFPFQVICTI